MTSAAALVRLAAGAPLAEGERREVARLAAAADWPAVLRLAASHELAPLVAQAVRPLPSTVVPPAVRERLEEAVVTAWAERAARGALLAAALRELAGLGCDALVLKGTALDLTVFAERPWASPMGDVDLALRPGRDTPTAALVALRRRLAARGFEANVGGHHDLTMNGLLPVRFDLVWQAAAEVAVHGARAWVPAPADALVAAAVNACRKRLVRLRGLVAIGAILRSAAVTGELLAARAATHGCAALAVVALAAAEVAVAAPVPGGAWERLGAVRGRGRALRALAAAHARSAWTADDGCPDLRHARAGLALVYLALGPLRAARSAVEAAGWAARGAPRRPALPPAELLALGR